MYFDSLNQYSTGGLIEMLDDILRYRRCYKFTPADIRAELDRRHNLNVPINERILLDKPTTLN